MDQEEPRITVETSVSGRGDEGRDFRRYSAIYYDPSKPEDNTLEQDNTPREALENLYQTLERKGFSRETLPKPRWPFRSSPP
jgi:hypothetical protein